MSTAQIEATALMCRLLDQADTRINGKALFEGPWAPAAHALFPDVFLPRLIGKTQIPAQAMAQIIAIEDVTSITLVEQPGIDGMSDARFAGARQASEP